MHRENNSVRSILNQKVRRCYVQSIIRVCHDRQKLDEESEVRTLVSFPPSTRLKKDSLMVQKYSIWARLGT